MGLRAEWFFWCVFSHHINSSFNGQALMTEENVRGGTPNNRWHLSKDIPISMLGVLLLQTILFTVFITNLAAKVNSVVEDNVAAKLTVYSKDDARHEREFMEQKLIILSNKDEEMLRRISLLEGAVGELRAKTALIR